MQDLIRVRIADAAEQVGIRQRALQRMVLPRERFSKLGKRCGHHVETAGIALREGIATRDDVERCLPLRASLGEDQRGMLEVDREQPYLARNARPPLLPP